MGNNIKKKYTEICDILDTIKEAIAYINEQPDEVIFGEMSFLFKDIRDAIAVVNQKLFGCESLNVHDIDKVLLEASEHRNRIRIHKLCEQWLILVEDSIMARSKSKNIIDERFVKLIDYVKYVEPSRIVEGTIKSLLSMPKEHIKRYNGYYRKFHYLWGMLDTEAGNYQVIENRVSALVNHWEDLQWLYDALGDYRSKLVLCNMLYSWLTFDPHMIVNMRENNFKDYYDLDLLQCDENEVIVDLGAYTGDSVLDYIESYGAYKKIYCYEISKKNAIEAEKNLSQYENIQLIIKGVGEKKGIMYVDEMGSSSQCSENETSGAEVEVVTLDDDIKEKVTLIKMDIEGAEQSALKGCRRHIIEEKPKLLVCVYHNNEDIWKIPKMIMDMRQDYKLYLRSNGQQWGPAEIVLFAL